MTSLHTYPIMRLTTEGVKRTRQYTVDCYHNKVQHGVVDRKFTKKTTSKGVIMLGKSGEVIVSSFYNAEIDWNIYIGGDNGYDLIINNIKTEIKTTSTRSLILNDPSHCQYGLWKSCIPQCILVWCNQPKSRWEDIDTNTKFQIVGSTTPQRFYANARKTNYGYGARLTLDERNLTHAIS